MTVDLHVIAIKPLDGVWWLLCLAPGPDQEAWIEMPIRSEQRDIRKVGDVLPVTFTVS